MSNPDNISNKPAPIFLSGTASESETATATLTVGVYFSRFHIQSAALFARQAAEIEKAYAGKGDDEQIANHRAFVTGAIFTAVAFIEAIINELYGNVYQSFSRVTDHLPPTAVAVMAAVWEEELKGRIQFSSLKKFQLALEWVGKESFPKGMSPYQEVDELIKLRNALIHYRTLWDGPSKGKSGEDKVHDLSRMLETRFSKKANPLVKPGSHFLHSYLSHACAQWAVDSSLNFVDTFFSKIDLLPAPYEDVRHRLRTA